MSQKTPQPLIIGATLEVSGKFAIDNSLSGVELAIKEINNAGGLLGRPLRLVVADNHSDETIIPETLKRLIVQEKAIALIGPSYSNLAIAAAPLADQYRVPFIATAATNPRVTVDDNGRTRPYAFRACFIDSAQGSGMAHFSYTNLNARTAALYIDDSASYSQGLASFFSEAFSKKGGRIVAKAGYTPNTQDFEQSVSMLLAANPDLIFVPGYNIEVLKIIRTVRNAGFSGPILGGDGWSSLLLMDQEGQSLDNTFFSCHYSPDDNSAVVQKFLSDFRSFTSGKTASQGDVLGYQAMMLLADAIRRADSDDPEKIRAELAKTIDFPGITGPLTLDKQHNALTGMMVLEIKNGKALFKERIQLAPR